MAFTVDCLYLTFEDPPELNELNGRAVMVEGVFKKESEYGEFYSGALKAVRTRALPEIRDISDRD